MPPAASKNATHRQETKRNLIAVSLDKKEPTAPDWPIAGKYPQNRQDVDTMLVVHRDGILRKKGTGGAGILVVRATICICAAGVSPARRYDSTGNPSRRDACTTKRPSHCVPSLASHVEPNSLRSSPANERNEFRSTSADRSTLCPHTQRRPERKNPVGGRGIAPQRGNYRLKR